MLDDTDLATGFLAHIMAARRFNELTTALMQSIADDEPQAAQLELIFDACNACDCVDDESIALGERASAAAAKNAADRERGAAAEAVVALGQQLNAPLHLVPDAGQLMRDYDAALAAYGDLISLAPTACPPFHERTQP